MTDAPVLWKRLVGFTLLPAIAAISPLLVLPVVSRVAGPAGWSSAIAGEAVGTFTAIAIAYGWTTIGPALVSIAKDDQHRGLLYREALVIRLLVAIAGLPAMGVVCWLIASPGFEWLSVLMGLQGALIALSFTWFAVGIGSPHAIAFYDAIPRLVAAALAAGAILAIGIVELYPLMGIAVTLIGTGLYTAGLLKRYPAAWPRRSQIPGLFRLGAPVALNDAALGAYSSVPVPLVNVISPPPLAAGYASADKMLKLGQFLPLTLANALQSWVAEVNGAARGRRIRAALLAHTVMGVVGWLGLAVLGAWASGLLFGEAAVSTTGVLVALGAAFAVFSLRTSMTRHILFPAGQAHAVMRATLISTAVGVPAMLALTLAMGPTGTAIAYASTEALAAALLIRRTVDALRRIDKTSPIVP